MGMIKIKEHRLKDSGITEFSIIPYNPFNKYQTIQIKFGGKYMLYNFGTAKEAESVIEDLCQKLPGFLRISENRWIRASSIRRYEVISNSLKIKFNGEQDSIKMNDAVKFKELVEYLDKSFEL